MGDDLVSAPEPSQETASLVRRLAGPSTTKAGLAIDQTEINRIIADASKGSKFYENEKKKDKELTEKIERILKYRDEILRGVDIHKIELAVDQQLAELESGRDLTQVIVHVDMDAFYANVELLDNPELEGKPFGVGGGVLTTASYEARKYGVRSGMPGFIAKKLCPELIFVKLHFSRYMEMSKKVMDVFRRYDPNMCPAGVDEGYLNITAYCKEHSISPDDCVQEMRAKVKGETKLTVSAGIAPNKMLAKICSDKNKPNGQFHLPFDYHEIIRFTHGLSIRKIPGIGRVNERLLESIGIKTCGDIYAKRAELLLMDKQFGLVFLLRTYLGIASNIVEPSRRDERKSIGFERTFAPMSDKATILRKLEECAEGLEDDMRRSGWTGKTVTLKFKLDTYQVFTRAKSLDRWVMKKEELFEIGKELLQPEWPLKIRLIGLRLTKLGDLHAPEPIGGIKRFFEPVDGPSKRPKFATFPLPDVPAVSHHDDDADVSSMPNFHEHEEDEVADTISANNAHDAEDRSEDDDSDAEHKVLIRHAKPKSTPAPVRTSYEADPSAAPAIKPKSSLKQGPSSTRAAVNKEPVNANALPASTSEALSSATTQIHQTCPVCSRSFAMDNQSFNAHIDFCLSRGAIKKAQIQATTGFRNRNIKRRV